MTNVDTIDVIEILDSRGSATVKEVVLLAGGSGAITGCGR